MDLISILFITFLEVFISMIPKIQFKFRHFIAFTIDKIKLLQKSIYVFMNYNLLKEEFL